MKMSEYQVINKCKVFAKEIFGKQLNIPVKFSGRMSSTYGYFQYAKSSHQSLNLTFSNKLLDGRFKEDTIDSVILHELCHWYLFEMNLPHQDGTITFESKIKEIGASSTRTIRQPVLNLIKCECCGYTYKYSSSTTKYTKKGSRYTSHCCKAKLIDAGEQVQIDTYIRKPALDPKIEAIIQKYKIEKETEEEYRVFKKDIVIAATKENKYKNLDGLNKILVPGRNGITNQQIIPAIKFILSNGTKEDLLKLKEDYSKQFESSIKYLGKKEQNKLYEMVG